MTSCWSLVSAASAQWQQQFPRPPPPENPKNRRQPKPQTRLLREAPKLTQRPSVSQSRKQDSSADPRYPVSRTLDNPTSCLLSHQEASATRLPLAYFCF